MNIGIFSGSFNPIHTGHLILANYVTEFTGIEEVWFLVSPQNPWKHQNELAGENARLEMVKLAVKDFPRLKASDFEFGLPRPSYTVNTLQELKKKYPQHEFSLIIGADNWQRFNQWKDYPIILANYQVYVYPRLNFLIDIPAGYSQKVTKLDSPVIEISSTFIRESLQQNKNMKAFLPCEVDRYILEHSIYPQD